eukprot:10370442-Karenia_brevis.AAC.1
MERCVRNHLLNRKKQQKVENNVLHVTNGRPTRRAFKETLEACSECLKIQTPTGACAKCHVITRRMRHQRNIIG